MQKNGGPFFNQEQRKEQNLVEKIQTINMVSVTFMDRDGFAF